MFTKNKVPYVTLSLKAFNRFYDSSVRHTKCKDVRSTSFILTKLSSTCQCHGIHSRWCLRFSRFSLISCCSHFVSGGIMFCVIDRKVMNTQMKFVALFNFFVIISWNCCVNTIHFSFTLHLYQEIWVFVVGSCYPMLLHFNLIKKMIFFLVQH